MDSNIQDVQATTDTDEDTIFKERTSLRKEMNFVDTTALIIGGTIGSGIFITPASILVLSGSFGVSMVCWLAGTLIAICGGLCYVELALLLPRSGGEFIYFLEGYSFRGYNKWTRLLGSLMAFLYAWAAFIVIRPTSLSIITLTCTHYLTQPFYSNCDIPDSVIKCLTISLLSKQLHE